MVTLKSCPFCSAEAHCEKLHGKYWVYCDNPKCKVQPCTEQNENKAVVVKAWNRRFG